MRKFFSVDFVIDCKHEDYEAVYKKLTGKGYKGFTSAKPPYGSRCYIGVNKKANEVNVYPKNVFDSLQCVASDIYLKRSGKKKPKNDFISIYGDGKTVFARKIGDHKNGFTATCGKNDKYRIGIGALLAVMRMFPEDVMPAFLEFVTHDSDKVPGMAVKRFVVEEKE